ncbi:MAG: hypothetical protein H0T79_02900, partial [Deltaproteobacteria bacterium]|nr:hypothetical protein [Deltaproteobacteria bacterium]
MELQAAVVMVEPTAFPDAHAEALSVLTYLAEDADELAPLLARHALAITEGADFAVARDALEALLRRLELARSGELVLKGTWRAGRCVIGRRGKAGRAYEVWVGDAEKLEGSCGCLDYAKAALGLCKHLLLAIERARTMRRRPGSTPALRWDPIRPLTGPGDWLERVWLDDHVPALARLFRAREGRRRIDPARIQRPAVRLATVESLLATCRHPAGAEPALRALLER